MISNENGIITFSYKDYAHGSAKKVMKLQAKEFLHRFCLHIFPPRFMKIRHCGILANRVKPQLKIQQMLLGVVVAKKEKQDWKEITKTKLNFDVDLCPCCKTGKMIRVHSFHTHASPVMIINKLRKNNQTVC